MKKHMETLAVLLAFGTWAAPLQAQHNYKSFIVSTYATQGTVQALMSGDTDPDVSWANLTRNLKIDKIYIEVMRNHTLVDEAGLEKLKKFYQDQGVQVCGGLAYSISEFNGFQGFDYADPANRDFAKKAAEMAARHFDEILLDDYYFFDRKTDADIKAKGNNPGPSIASKPCARSRRTSSSAPPRPSTRNAKSSSRWPTGTTNTPAWAMTLRKSPSSPTAYSPAPNPAFGSGRNSTFNLT